MSRSKFEVTLRGLRVPERKWLPDNMVGTVVAWRRVRPIAKQQVGLIDAEGRFIRRRLGIASLYAGRTMHDVALCQRLIARDRARGLDDGSLDVIDHVEVLNMSRVERALALLASLAWIGGAVWFTASILAAVPGLPSQQRTIVLIIAVLAGVSMGVLAAPTLLLVLRPHKPIRITWWGVEHEPHSGLPISVRWTDIESAGGAFVRQRLRLRDGRSVLLPPSRELHMVLGILVERELISTEDPTLRTLIRRIVAWTAIMGMLGAVFVAWMNAAGMPTGIGPWGTFLASLAFLALLPLALLEPLLNRLIIARRRRKRRRAARLA